MSETNPSFESALKAIKHYNDSIGKLKKSDKNSDDKKPKKGAISGLTTFDEWKTANCTALDVIPTGIPELDDASGIGGFPKGKMVELFGTESGGKSYISYKTIASCQKAGGVAALLDVENSFTEEWARVIGIDLKSLIYKNEFLTMEQYLQLACDLCSGGYVDLLVIDSTAALLPQVEAEGNIGDQTMALQARILSPAVRKIMAAAAQKGKGGKQTCVIWINQIREKPGVMWGCFHYNARVILEDGTSMKIGKIVNNKMELNVMSYNIKNGKIEPKKIIDWHNNGNVTADDGFIQIVAEKFGENGVTNIPCTKNHILFKSLGFSKEENRFLSEEIEAGKLKIGDEILISQPKYLNNDQLQLVYGSVLGDGYLKMLKKGNYILRIKHGPKQKEYAIWKQNILSEITSTIEDNDVYSFSTIPMYELKRLSYHKGVGKNCNCEIPNEIFENINLLGLTIWYLDDGNYSREYGFGKSSICCKKFENREKFLSVFEKFGLKPTIRKAGFVFNVEETKKLHSMICNMVPPCMEYKLHPEFRGKYNSSLLNSINRISNSYSAIPSKIIKIYDKPITRTKRKFDLTIEDNSTYLIDGAIVHNSPETTPGGKALKFYCHMRVDVRKKEVEYVTQGEDRIPVAQISRGTFVKNKVANPFTKFETKISFASSYTNPFVMLANLAKGNKLFYKTRGAYKYQPDEESEAIITGAVDFISLGKWIYDSGKKDEIITKLTELLIESGEDIPSFLEEFDENTKPPLAVKDKIPVVSEEPSEDAEEDDK